VIARFLVVLAARILPRRARARYREEWLGDLDAATGAGVRPMGVALGALVTSVSADRTLPMLTDVSAEEYTGRLVRRAFACLAGAGTWGMGLLATRDYATVRSGENVVVAGIYYAWFLAAVALATAFALAAAVLVMRALAATRSTRVRIGLVVFVLGIAATVAGALSLVSGQSLLTWNLLSLGLLALLVGGIVALVAVLTAPRSAGRVARGRRASMRVAIGVALPQWVLFAIGAVDILVWDPLAHVPGETIEGIYASLPQAAWSYIAPVVLWAVFWSAVAALPAVSTRVRSWRFPTSRGLVVASLLTVGLALFFRFWSGFGVGMDVADTFLTDGGLTSSVSRLLAMVGTSSLAAGALLAIHPRREPVPVAA
jgi:hypothetical protein